MGLAARAHQVAVDAVGEAGAAGAIADEVVAAAGEGPEMSGLVPVKSARFRATMRVPEAEGAARDGRGRRRCGRCFRRRCN